MPLAMLPSICNYIASLVCAYTENQLQYVTCTKSLTNPNFIQFGMLSLINPNFWQFGMLSIVTCNS